jgi:glycosyltransferase involved in cell wall biosynthesis
MAGPRVSIVTATYNRSRVLRQTITSVIAQRFTDWELMVVGDACTDDTAEVVASFRDPRIRFHSLPRNVGEQSGPNNAGVAATTGDLIAFLNHDDLWFPDHLELLVAARDTGSEDLVFSLMSVIIPGQPAVLSNVAPAGRYEPHVVVPASAWLLTRTLWNRVGPWRSFRQCYQAPSQEWLMRAWRGGALMRMVPSMTVIAFPSGHRRNSYVSADDSEQARYAARLDPGAGLREELLLSIALGQALAARHSLSGTVVGPYLVRGARNLLRSALAAAGISPAAFRLFLRSRRKGYFIDTLRQARGLPVIPRERIK